LWVNTIVDMEYVAYKGYHYRHGKLSTRRFRSQRVKRALYLVPPIILELESNDPRLLRQSGRKMAHGKLAYVEGRRKPSHYPLAPTHKRRRVISSVSYTRHSGPVDVLGRMQDNEQRGKFEARSENHRNSASFHLF